MCKKLIYLAAILSVLYLVGNASAVNVKWDGGGGADQLWSNAANWDVGVPGPADTVRLDGTYTALIDSTVAAEAVHLYGPGVDLSGLFTLNMTGGSLDVGGNMEMTYGAASSGLWNMSGGTVNIAAELWVSHDGVATITMTGGTINVSSGMYIPKISTGDGHVNLDGGVINAASFYMRSSGGVGTMDITDGTLIVNGDVTSTINTYISNGWITAYGGSGALNVDYNVTNPGKTTVTANTPEKASSPSPINGATGVDINADLSWTAGIYAVSHDVYFGTDPTPDETEFIRNQPETMYDPGTMELNTTYYWRIDEVNDAHPNSPWTGDVWSFTTYTGTANFRKGPYLLYPGDNTQMQVLWQLDESGTCTIEWGTDTTYSDGSANTSEYGTDHQHSYTIGNLTPGTMYYYRVTAGVNQYTGDFTAAPATSATDVKFLMYGDTRTNPGDHDSVAARMIATYNADPACQTVLMLSGDWVNSNSEDDWTNEFFNYGCGNIMENLRRIPINGCMGNHEGGGSVYMKYWPYPYVGGRYWSFDYGPAHIVILDQYTPYSTGSAQYNWLVNDLSNSTKTWKVIILHQPGWSAGGGHGNDPDVQNYIQPLCLQYGVQMVVGGHNHYYARAVVDSVQHITSGGGGAPLHTPSGGEFIVVMERTFNFQKVEISGNSLTCTTYRPDGSVVDTFNLSEGPPPLPGKATNPNPADGATDVSVDADLSWTAGEYADSHDVYFGTNPTPGAGEFIRNQTETTYNPGTMAANTTYYWRIDEKNETGTTTGDVWSFTTESPCVASTTHVESVVCGILRLNPPKSYGQVTVTIYDNCGDPVGGADVTGTFTGDFNEQLTETTNGSGVAVITTTTEVKKPSYSFCVDSVTHATLTYDPNDNIETCCSY